MTGPRAKDGTVLRGTESAGLTACAVDSVTVGPLVFALDEVLEGARVVRRLAALAPPLPLTPDGRAEPDFEHRIEALVSVREDRAEQSVQFVGRDRVQRHPA